LKQLLFILLTLTIGCKERREVNKSIHVTTSPDFNKGESFFKTKKDSAFYYFNKVTDSSQDSLQIAMAYNYMAVMQLEAGDYFSSQESLLKSLKYLNEDKKNDYYCLSSDYCILGNNCLNLKKYNNAIDYYDLALKFAIDDNLKLFALNSKAVAYQKKEEYSQAIAIYNAILNQRINNKMEYARILSNLARVKWLQHPGYQPLPEFYVALKIRQDEKDNWGLNASYSHLSDYYSPSRPDSALSYALKMYEVAQRINSPDDELEALQKLIKLSRPEELRQYVTCYQYLSDSVQTARSAAKNQYVLIGYEAEKNKADNLVLQKDNTEKKIQILQQRIILYGILLLFLFVAFIAILWYRKRRQRMVMEARDSIREHQLKISQKVHDVVANGIYQIMAGLEHHGAIEKEHLADKLEILYEQSRDISYEHPTKLLRDFQEEIDWLLTSFATQTTKVFIVGNNINTWHNTSANIKNELLQVLQELMINMKKHSCAHNVVARFERQGNQISIQYQDDGVGLPASFQYGNGLTNTGNRIKGIGGQIIFDRAATNGLKVRVSFPVI
jgi:signal transduction histidine kinase